MLMLIILWCDTAEQNKETDPHICIHICLRMKTGEININIILDVTSKLWLLYDDRFRTT